MWSACRWERKTLVVDSTGSRSEEKLAIAPEPRSKKKKSFAGLPTSISSDPEAWLRLMNGSPLHGDPDLPVPHLLGARDVDVRASAVRTAHDRRGGECPDPAEVCQSRQFALPRVGHHSPPW
jgi:hypothetical protein